MFLHQLDGEYVVKDTKCEGFIHDFSECPTYISRPYYFYYPGGNWFSIKKKGFWSFYVLSDSPLKSALFAFELKTALDDALSMLDFMSKLQEVKIEKITRYTLFLTIPGIEVTINTVNSLSYLED